MRQEYEICGPGEMTDYPALPALIPLVTIRLPSLPNMNDILFMSPIARSGAVRGSRQKGYKAGLSIARKLGLGVSVHRIKGRGKSIRDIAIEKSDETLAGGLKVFTILSVWHERGKKDPEKPNRKRDVYNPLVKSFIDGLTDSGLWVDDNAMYHTDFWVTYRGLDKESRWELSFYGFLKP